MCRALKLSSSAAGLCALLTVAVLPQQAAGQTCRTRVRFMLRDAGPCDVTLWPVNVTLGYGAMTDADGSRGTLAVGVQVVTLTWRNLFWNAGEIDLLFFGVTGEDGQQGIGGSFFVGSRPGLVLRAGRTGRHHLVLNVGLGWGSIGPGSGTSTGLVVSPGVRYAYMGFAGVELQAYLPAYREADPYPAAITVNLVGIPMALLAALR